MWVLTIRFIIWLSQKIVPLFLVAGLIVAAAALYLYTRDNLEVEIDRTRQLEALEATEEKLANLRQEAAERRDALQAQAEAAQRRYQQAERLIANLEALRGFWENLFRSSEEKERERQRLVWAQQKKEEIGWSVDDLAGQVLAARKTVDDLEERILDLQRERDELERGESEMISYTQKAWLAVRTPLLAGIAMFLFGPTAWKIGCYYFWAPLIALGRPIRLAGDQAEEIRAAPSMVSNRVSLAPGERAVLKEKFLQASDEALRRRTRFVFDWRIPFSSAACGLIELTQMINTGEREYSITFSTQEEPMTELSVIELPAAASLVLRPSHLAGVVTRADQRLKIDRHWRLLSLHAWVTLQFRYFEFHGPCRLIVCGQRGVRAEFMRSGEGEALLARRTNQDSTIGFTPNLMYHSARAETFWAYYRGRNPLFDDLFRGGSGAFICQEISSRGSAWSIRRFWSSFWGALLKVFGL